MLQLNNKNPPEKQAEILLDLLLKSSKRALEACCKVLCGCNRSQIADLLMEQPSKNRSPPVIEQTQRKIQELIRQQPEAVCSGQQHYQPPWLPCQQQPVPYPGQFVQSQHRPSQVNCKVFQAGKAARCEQPYGSHSNVHGRQEAGEDDVDIASQDQQKNICSTARHSAPVRDVAVDSHSREGHIVGQQSELVMPISTSVNNQLVPDRIRPLPLEHSQNQSHDQQSLTSQVAVVQPQTREVKANSEETQPHTQAHPPSPSPLYQDVTEHPGSPTNLSTVLVGQQLSQNEQGGDFVMDVINQDMKNISVTDVEPFHSMLY